MPFVPTIRPARSPEEAAFALATPRAAGWAVEPTGCAAVVADGGRRLLGVALLRETGGIGRIECLWVELGFRGRGIGEALLRTATSGFRAEGLYGFLAVWPARRLDAAGRRLMRRLGFVERGTGGAWNWEDLLRGDDCPDCRGACACARAFFRPAGRVAGEVGV